MAVVMVEIIDQIKVNIINIVGRNSGNLFLGIVDFI